MIQFVTGGLEISLTVAIDFTGSNGDQDKSSSLHYISPTGALNAYEKAINGVGNILEAYDSDKKYPVYGFGAKTRTPEGDWGIVQHCFSLSAEKEVDGVSGILKAYKECLPKLLFSGPTLFTPLINKVTELAAGLNCSQSNQKYLVLLIITDGEINDMETTKTAIIRASDQPMSIIIVGVGSANFSSMDALDSDKQLVSGGGKTSKRDNVQFVP